MVSLTSGAVTDRHIVTVLRPFVLGTRPVLEALRESDPFGLRRRMVQSLAVDGPTGSSGAGSASLADDEERGVLRNAKETVLDWVSAVHVPGTPAWAAMTPHERTDWWIGRVGRFTALLAAVPGIGGALADRLPVQDALGAAGQGLLLCAIAGEHGVRGEDDQIRLLARVLFDRDVESALAEAAGREETQGDAQRRSAELTAELSESRGRHGRVTLRAAAGTVWKLGRLLWGLGEELGKRPQGRWYHKALGMLPIVGMAGDYLGERSALRRAARAAAHWLAARPPGN